MEKKSHLLETDMKDKIKLDNAASTVFAPQLVGLVTTINYANQPNVATFAWIMSTSHDPELIAVSVSKARYTYDCLTDEFVVNLPTKELVEQVWMVGTLSGRNINKFGEFVAKSGDFDAMEGGTLNEHIEPLFHLGGTRFLSGQERIDVNELFIEHNGWDQP
jgi:flavin reductase (DIM6/NTAB) family NADH-FMN oxidoreductase RutF